MSLRTLESWSHGAVLLDAENTRFSLWAPDAFYVSVELEDGRSLAMLPQNDGWFTLQTRCRAGTRYRYNIDGELQVCDPASRAQAGGIAAQSVVVDPLAYHWRHKDWQGRPAEFPGERNWGYDGVLPYAPQSSYGTPEDLKHLIDSAHGHGLAVILDVVYNHFGPDGNYLGHYAKDFFRDDQQTPWGAAIDFQRREVRSFFIDNALMWLLEYRFDGLRLDAVHAINDSTFLRELARQVRRQTDPTRHVWLTVENEFNQASLLEEAYDGQWNDDGHNTLHVLLTGETEAYYADYARETTDKLARCLSQGFVYQGHPNRSEERRAEASPAVICRPRRSSCSCRTTTRSATAPLANVSTNCARPRRCGLQRCCLKNPFCSSPTTTASWPMRYARGGVRSSPSLPVSPTRSGAHGFPTRTTPAPLKRHARAWRRPPTATVQLPPGCTASCWRFATANCCPACQVPRLWAPMYWPREQNSLAVRKQHRRLPAPGRRSTGALLRTGQPEP